MMVELFVVQLLLLAVLITYLVVEETLLDRLDVTRNPYFWEVELAYYEWVDEAFSISAYVGPLEPKPLDAVASGMDLAGWHQMYGAFGWAGIPYPPNSEA
jgi:hypothetical protein